MVILVRIHVLNSKTIVLKPLVELNNKIILKTLKHKSILHELKTHLV